MISSRTRKLMTSGVAALLLAAGSVLAGSTPASAAYSDCPYGRVCVFEGWGGTGLMGYAVQCGRNEIAGSALDHKVSSVRTHGNGVSFYRYNHPEWRLAYVGPWTQTNLSLQENDLADYMYVEC
ncbi:peptidase inhibitor family I36 protein [Streptomyces sp. NPDC057690]|uniref:peptidase inhibitor family I36 protein n=1 Tax=Streptomyces sp. NPDC057690 TaxID=3346214 RepID=UPI0036842F9F